jgi:hypothetical protein
MRPWLPCRVPHPKTGDQQLLCRRDNRECKEAEGTRLLAHSVGIVSNKQNRLVSCPSPFPLSRWGLQPYQAEVVPSSRAQSLHSS